MTLSGMDNGSMLGAGIKQPNCWQFFGFDGPTNKHNLKMAYTERLHDVWLLGFDPSWTSIYILNQYKECLAMLDGSPCEI